jgi:hypothetical protein
LIKGDLRSAVIAFHFGRNNRIEDKGESFFGLLQIILASYLLQQERLFHLWGKDVILGSYF